MESHLNSLKNGEAILQKLKYTQECLHNQSRPFFLSKLKLMGSDLALIWP